MTTLHVKTCDCDDCVERAARLEHPADLAHYLRQATISLRRNSPRINHVWNRTRHTRNNPSLWSR